MLISSFVAADGGGEIWTYTDRPKLQDNMRYWSDKGQLHCNQFNLNLKPLQIVEIIIDTETQTYKIKKIIESGWYLTRYKNGTLVFARYFNGANGWHYNPRLIDVPWVNEDEFEVVSEKLNVPFLESWI